MKVILKKAGVIILIYYSMVLLQACCNCEEPELPYFDYKSIRVDTYGPFPLSLYPEAGFGFTIRLDSIEYLAKQKHVQPQWNLINTAYACSCNLDGDLGEKYSLKEINIYADTIFDESIPSTEPLNSLFEVATFYNNETQKYEKIPLDSIQNYPYRLHPSVEIMITSHSIPVALNQPYHFVIEVIKENGAVIRSTVGPLVWKN